MFLLMAAYLASRGLGVARQSIFNALFGAGPQANAYYAAFQLPDTLFNLITGGAFIQAFVPIFVSYEGEQGNSETWRLASLVFNVLFVALVGIVILGEFAAPFFVSHWLIPGYSSSVQVLTTTLTRIMLLHPLILGLSTIATAILSSKRRFFLPALSIAIYNIGLIAGLIFTLVIPSAGIYGPTFGVLLGAAFQMLIQVPGLLKQKFRYTFIWDLKHPGLRKIMRLLGPNVLAAGITSIGLIIDTSFTSYFSDKASLAAIHNAHMLFYVPVAFLGQTLVQATLPQMSALASPGSYARLRQLVLNVVRGAILFSIPIAILLIVLGKPAIHLLFQHRAFTLHASTLTYLALVGYALALPGMVASQLLTNSFYALKDALSPLLTNVVTFAMRIGLILLLLRILAGTYIVMAIPLAAAGAMTIEAALLVVLLLPRLTRKIRADSTSSHDQ